MEGAQKPSWGLGKGETLDIIEYVICKRKTNTKRESKY